MLAQITDLCHETAGRNGAVTPPDPDHTRERTATMAAPADIPSTKGHKDKGAQGELIAAAWLLGLGYQVFRNVSPTGPVDIVAWCQTTGERYLIDVKSMGGHVPYLSPDGSVNFSMRVSLSEVHPLIVIANKVIGFWRKESGFYWPLSCDPVPPCSFEAAESAAHLKRAAREGSMR